MPSGGDRILWTESQTLYSVHVYPRSGWQFGHQYSGLRNTDDVQSRQAEISLDICLTVTLRVTAL